jgi:Anti-sigma-K factor rskA
MPDTSPSLTPESWSELMAGYVLGDLTPAEIDRVEAYLLAHPERQAEIASLMLPLDLLPLMPTDLPPDSLKVKILQAATAPASGALIPITQLPKKTRQWWKPIAAALELTLIAYFGWYNYRLSQELATVKQDLKTAQIAKRQPAVNQNQDRSLLTLLQQPNNRLIPLKNMPAQTGAGSLIVVPQKSIAVLILQKVKPLPPGQIYRTWAIMGEEEMSCADFLPDKDGKVFLKIPLDRLKKANKLMVTIEQKSATAAAGEIAIEGEI